MTYLIFFSRSTLFVVFSAALVGKLHSRVAWSSFVRATGILLGVHRMREVWAVVAVLVEAVSAACLAFDRTAYAGLILALLGVFAFFFVVLNAVRRGVEAACNCFGSDGANLTWAHVWRNMLLVGIATVGLGVAMGTDVPPAFAGAAYATPFVMSLIAAGLLVRWDDLMYLVTGITEPVGAGE